MKFNHRYLIDYVAQHLPNGGRALDYGCGKGDVVAGGRRQGIDLFGVDVFYKDGRTREDIEEKGLLGTVVKEIRDGVVDFPEAHFDLVVSNQVFEHVKNLDSVLAEIVRVLKPGGTLHALFPVRETWWEGHFGVPFLHNFQPGSFYRLAYARLWRSLGFGYNHADRSVSRWAEYVCNWIDNYTTYRPKREMVALLEKHFGEVRFIEEEYLRYRLAHSALPLKGVFLFSVDTVPGRELLRGIYRKRAGIVITASKSQPLKG